MTEDQSPQTQPTQPTTNNLNSKKISNLPINKKKFIFLFLGLIFFLITTSAITLRQTKTPPPEPPQEIPSGWMSFTDSLRNYQLHYPSSWKIHEYVNHQVILQNIDNDINKAGDFAIIINMLDFPEGTDIKEWIMERVLVGAPVIGPKPPKSISLKSLSPSLPMSYDVIMANDLKTLLIPHPQKKNTYAQSIMINWPSDEPHNLFYQILSTINFINDPFQTCYDWLDCQNTSCPESKDPLCDYSPICADNKCECTFVCQ